MTASMYSLIGMPSNIHRITNLTDNATTTTIYAVPATGKFYLTSATLKVFKDSGSNANGMDIKVTTATSSREILKILSSAATAQDEQISITLANPLLIDPSTNITTGMNDATSVGRLFASITGIYLP